MGKAQDIGNDFIAAFNEHDEAKIRNMTADNAIMEAPGGVRLEGGDASAAYAVSWMRAFPDSKITVHNTLEAGDSVVQEFTFEGTHTDTLPSPAGDIPATNRSMVGRAVQVIRVEDDLVAETKLYFDQVQVLTQLGLMPEPATSS